MRCGDYTTSHAVYCHSYKDAVATIRRTTTDKNYQLVITRAYEEGEEQLLEEEEECECDPQATGIYADESLFQPTTNAPSSLMSRYTSVPR